MYFINQTTNNNFHFVVISIKIKYVFYIKLDLKIFSVLLDGQRIYNIQWCDNFMRL